MYQVLIDGSTATYENVLTSDADPRDLQDNYACIVIDSADRRSQIVDVDVEGDAYISFISVHSALIGQLTIIVHQQVLRSHYN